MGNNQYPPHPSLIREGAPHVDMLDNSCQHLSCNSEGATLPCKDKFSSRFPPPHSSPRRKAAFTLAEMMVVMLILSIIMAAMAPVMTTRNKLDQSSPWVWAENGSDAYYGLGDAQVAMIGQQEAEDTDTNSRLVINTGDGKDHLLFKQGNSVLGRLRFDDDTFLLGEQRAGSVLEDRAMGIGLGIGSVGARSIAIGQDIIASGSGSIGISPAESSVTGDNSVAIGSRASAGGSSTVAIGTEVSATGAQSLALGSAE